MKQMILRGKKLVLDLTLSGIPDSSDMQATRALLKELNVKPHTAAGRGKPGDPILEKLTIKYVHKKNGKAYYSCVAINDGCYFIRAGNVQKDRVFPHAAHCNLLSDELRHLVDATAAQSSLGRENWIIFTGCHCSSIRSRT